MYRLSKHINKLSAHRALVVIVTYYVFVFFVPTFLPSKDTTSITRNERVFSD